MTEMFGITVINDATAGEQSDELGVGITTIVRLKHAALYGAAKALGSAAALARHLEISQVTIGEWINLKSCPPREASTNPLSSFTEEKMIVLEAKLLQLTGMTWEELWPESLRQNDEFLGAPKQMEKTFRLQQKALTAYAAATRERFISESKCEADEDEMLDTYREVVNKCLHLLTLRERKILAMRFGINTPYKTTEEVAVEMNVGRQRIHQIQDAALAKLRRFGSMELAKIEKAKQEIVEQAPVEQEGNQ